MSRVGYMLSAICMVFMLFTLSSHGQSPTANYRFAESNELTIIVNLLGAVQKPGRYEISRTIDLPNLLSLAGGGSENADLSHVRITRVLRTTTRTERRELMVNIEDLTKTQDGDMVLNDGDFVFVPRSGGLSVQEVVSYVTTAALLTTAVLTIINQTK